MAYRKEIEISKFAVKEAMKLCQKIQAKINEKKLRHKADQSLVTVADYASQILITKILRENFPNDCILAEEEGSLLLSDKKLLEQVLKILHEANYKLNPQNLETLFLTLKKRDNASRFWVLDPIDGTAGFVKKTHYAIALALIDQGQVGTATLACPNLEQNFNVPSNAIYSAVKGQGAYCEKRQLFVKKNDREAIICVSPNPQHSSMEAARELAKKLQSSEKLLPVHGQCKYALLIEGLADIYHRKPINPNYREKIWDHAAGYLLLKEAGGYCTDQEKNELIWNFHEELSENFGILATSNKQQQEEL